MPTRYIITVLGLFALFSPGRSAVAQPKEDLKAAQRMINKELRYKAAIAKLDRLLTEPELNDTIRIEAYRLLGIAYVARGATKSAEAAFAALLKISPGYHLDARLSPKILEVFERAKQNTYTPPRLLNLTALPKERAITFTGRLLDPENRVRQVELFTRSATGRYTKTEMLRAEDSLSAMVLYPKMARVQIDYHVIAKDQTGRPLVTAGTADNPLKFVFERRTEPALVTQTVDPPSIKTPWYERWWVWTLVGVAVVAGGSAAFIVLRPKERTPMGTLDPIQLDLRAR